MTSRSIILAVRKPTIVNPDTGEWADRPPPPQDTEWLKRHGYCFTDLKDANNGNLR
ncbi:MAG TPA: hypothetical protein VFT69_16945 [Pseudolabrys sp.]|nr:hypothetical protein [Pseudolabrys sp.]